MQTQETNNFATFLRRYKEFLVGAVLFSIFVGIIIGAQQVQLILVTSVNARFWPTVIGIIGCLLSCSLMVQGFTEGKELTKKENSGEVLPPDVTTKWFKGGNRRTLLTLALLFVYCLVLDFIGFLISTVLYLIFQIYLLTDPAERKPIRIAIISVVFTAVVYVVFYYVLMLILPTGRLWSQIL
jgi:putative tricarboxylic transport membrane protein